MATSHTNHLPTVVCGTCKACECIAWVGPSRKMPETSPKNVRVESETVPPDSAPNPQAQDKQKLYVLRLYYRFPLCPPTLTDRTDKQRRNFQEQMCFRARARKNTKTKIPKSILFQRWLECFWNCVSRIMFPECACVSGWGWCFRTEQGLRFRTGTAKS